MSAKDQNNKSKKLKEIPSGYSAAGGCVQNGWYGALLLYENNDLDLYQKEATDNYYNNLEAYRRMKAEEDLTRRIVLLHREENQIEQIHITCAERISGPVCPQEEVESPVIAWSEYQNNAWELKLLYNNIIKSVVRQNGIIRSPEVAMTSRGPVISGEVDRGHGNSEIKIWNLNGKLLHHREGQNPKLVAADEGYFLLTEVSSSNQIKLVLEQFKQGKCIGQTEIAKEGYLFNAHLVWSQEEKAAYIAGEKSPSFGYSSQLGLDREIHTWRWQSGTLKSFGNLPVEERGFMSIGPENLPPIQPQVLIDDGIPVVIFKQFRYDGHKTFGWDIFWSRRKDNQWTEPERLNETVTSPDTGYSILPVADHYLGIFPALFNPGGSSRSTKHRVEVVKFNKKHGLPRFEVWDDKKADYTHPTSYQDIAPEPPNLPESYPGRKLIWGDLHVHSTYSKCVAAVDGSPQENLRFLRDVIGCQVFTLTEHSHRTIGPESSWTMDQLEMMAGDNGVVLYSSEPPGISDIRDTNWYTYDREVFERLEQIFEAQGEDLQNSIRNVCEELPPDSVYFMRHFHGGLTEKEEMISNFDPRLEVAMESMQGRCNAMLAAEGDYPEFPNQFLDSGRKISLVGGTDHYRSGPNHYCLTGFWVQEVSARGVWEALKNGYTFAMSDSKVAMTAYLGDKPMGRSVTLNNTDQVRIGLNASCGNKIRRATLIKDGKLLPWVEVDDKVLSLDLVDSNPGTGWHWYVPTIELDTAYEKETPGYSHGSPFHVMIRK